MLELAGPRVFERGCRYHDEGRVDLSGTDAGCCRALVHGTGRYRVTLRLVEGDLEWHCDCPAAADGSFCKHLVATALAWRDAVAETTGEPSARATPDLLDRLNEQPRERLAQWLHEAALDDPDLRRRIEMRLAGDDPAALQSALDSLLRVRGFLDYRRSMDYAARLVAPIESLHALLDEDPRTTLALAERALKRLLKILERTDDSAGTLQDRIAELGDLHARAAARADIDARSFARALHGLKKRDEWDFLPLAAYWDALPERGRAAYRTCVEKEYASLPAAFDAKREPGSDVWRAELPILHRREELARCEHDCDALIEVFSRDLGSGYGYRCVVEACREYGREAEATRWAERGVREHPDWPGLRELLADCYRRAGMTEEALEQMRQAFRDRPNEETWSLLREAAGDAWPGIREEALALVARKEPGDTDGKPRDVTLRVRLLEADGDIDGAVDLALRHPVYTPTLAQVAELAAESRPADAARLLQRVVESDLRPTDARGYPGIVRKIVRVQSLARDSDTRDWVDGIRNRYKARRKLMQLMDGAGL